MPKLGLTMKTGKVARWLVAEGASVHQGDEIFEVETDKITNRIESPADGVLVQILVPQGETVAVGTVLGLLGEAGEAVAAKPEASSEAKAEAGTEAKAQASEKGADKVETAAAPEDGTDGAYILATPRAKALARFLEMDLRFVKPTGRGGRIREADVLARKDVLSSIAITPLARVLATQAGLDICALKGTGEGGKIVKADVELALNPAAAQVAQAKAGEAAREGAEVSVRSLVLEEGRGSVARVLCSSLNLTACLDLLEGVKRLGVLYKARADVLGLETVLGLVVARTLARHAELNAVYADGQLASHSRVDLLLRKGPGDAGSLVPDAATLGILALADAQKACATGPATCTFTSYAATRIERATGELRDGQAAALVLGSVRQVPVLAGTGAVACPCANLSLVYDARLVSEEAACAFMDDLVRAAEDPLGLVF